MRVLILDQVVFEFGKGERLRLRAGKGGARVFAEELVDNFGEKLVGHEGGVVLVADYDTGDPLSAAVGVKGIGWERLEGGSGMPSVLVWYRNGWLLVGRKSLAIKGGDYALCSSISCRCPGFVRSATVLLNRVMNSP